MNPIQRLRHLTRIPRDGLSTTMAFAAGSAVAGVVFGVSIVVWLVMK